MAFGNNSDINVNIKVNKTDFDRGISGAKQGLGGLTSMSGTAGKGLDSLGGSLGSLAARLGPAAIAVGAVTAAFKSFKSSIDFASTISDMSARLGVTSDEFQRLSVIAKDSGVDAANLGAAYRTLSKEIADNSPLLRAMGVATKDAKGNLRDANAVMNEAVAVLAEMQNETQKNVAAQKLFGRGGLDVLQILRSNKDAFKETTEEMRKQGLILSEESTKSLDDVGDAWEELRTRISVAIGEINGTIASGILAATRATRRDWLAAIHLAKPQEKGIGPAPQLTEPYKMTEGKSSKEKEIEAALSGDKKTEPRNMYGETAAEEMARIRQLNEWKAAEANKERIAAQDAQQKAWNDENARRNEELKSEMEWSKEKRQKRQDAREQEIEDQKRAGEKAREIAEQQKAIEQAKADFQRDVTLSSIQMMGYATQAMAANAKQRKMFALIETVAYGAVSSALAWKEAFAAKDTGGFYQKLASAIIGTAAAVANTAVALSTINRYATGTRSSGNGLSLVGENGPELVRMPAGSTVYNNAETRNIYNNSTSTATINVTSGGITETFKAAIRSGAADRLLSDMFGRARRMGFATA